MSIPSAVPVDTTFDDWTPAPLPVEHDPEQGVQHQAYQPVPAVLVAEVRQVQEAVEQGAPAPHIAALDPWTRWTPAERDEHIASCDDCPTCADHRAEAWCDAYGHLVVILDDGRCPDCGRDHLNEHNFDVKASER